jgi:ArsR family transcriptional regulator, arsenate/arsenite/antimonite-responsive transcriptional repressor
MDNDTFEKLQRALAEPKRLEIMSAIRRLHAEGLVTCSDVLDEMTISQSTFSHHISELAEANAIHSEKSGRCYHLSVNEPVIEAYLRELHKRLLEMS